MKTDTRKYEKFKKEMPFHDRLASHFYDDKDKLAEVFNKTEIDRVMRLRWLHNEVLNNPMRPNSDNVRLLKSKYGIQERQAQYDIADLRSINGLMRINKEAERFEISQFLRQCIQEAKEKGDYRSVASLAKEYKSINRLDKEEAEPLDPAKMYPAQAEPTTDVTVLGLIPSRPGLKEELRKMFGKDTYAEYQEAQFMEEKEGDPIEETKTLIERL